ncbi:MAG: efflux RND transporter periplasmic adaptor subunit [Myxococcales bacterium]|nr:efflux RND transporter periplasmic adaptor subunit [Polyangiaceae bacterium]MDW8249162.1 efflux RND transporter periplasmic adaptor subunit [Myxococcales bacterium]
MTVPPAVPSATRNLERELASVEGGRKWLKRLVVVGILGGVVVGGWVWRRKHAPPPPARYLTQGLTEGDVIETVQSTGVVKPVTEVKVGAQVSGRVARVMVDFNSQVKKGDLLAEIDPMLLGAQVQQQRAQLAAQKAMLAGAEARVLMAKVNLERLKKLRVENLANQAEVDQAQGQLDIAQAEVAQAKAQMAATSAAITAAGANLSLTKIYAPIDGVVTDRQVDEGQTVAASFQAPVLFVIAEDLRRMRVYADVDEADVGKLSEGMEAEAQVDAFPGERFKGTVGQVRYSPNSVQGVVTYTAVIEVSNPERKLRPGMTATVTVRTKEARKVLRLPNAALRFKPTPEKGPDGKPLPTPPEKPLEPGTGRVFVLLDPTPGREKIEPRVLKIGITDGVYTALLDPLGISTRVVVDEVDDKEEKKRGSPRLF